MKIVLPWPDSRLSPNAKRRKHWRVYQPVTKKARADAAHATIAAAGADLSSFRKQIEGEAPIPIQVTFFPPDRRRRDDDGMIGSFKAARDGIADALGVDDRRFRPHYFFEDACKPGRVEVCFHRAVRDQMPGSALRKLPTYPQGSGSDQCANTKSEPDHERTGDAS